GAVEPPRVYVTVRQEAAESGELLIRVRDDGPGLPPGDPDALFERGWSTRGSGLGLALVRQTATRHHGTATAAPRAGGGAEFTVRIPL
ncbi:sensor histidine kinase, partial [Streptomyces boncukensis]